MAPWIEDFYRPGGATIVCCSSVELHVVVALKNISQQSLARRTSSSPWRVQENMIDLGDDFFWPSTSPFFLAYTCSVSASPDELRKIRFSGNEFVMSSSTAHGKVFFAIAASQVGCWAYWTHGKRTCRYASESVGSRSSTGDVICELTVYTSAPIDSSKSGCLGR